MNRWWVGAACLSLSFGTAHADAAASVAQDGCRAIAALVDAAAPGAPPDTPAFLPSYPDPAPAGSPPIDALRGTAFVYDNALAAIALLACHDAPRARRIGAALAIAAGHDRFWHDGRLRNAYRAGPVAPGTPPALPGWWDAAARRWDEDPYAVGTATGNVAWAALALETLARRNHDADAAAAAGTLMGWIARTVATPTGYAGGFVGEEPHPTRLGWLSTEHNVDVAAVFALRADPCWAAGQARAAGFVASMWNDAAGRFWLGTADDGHTINRNGSGIDAQLWPLIGIAHAPPAWQRAKAWVRAHHATDGGYGFRDTTAQAAGLWTEGTAQATLILPDAQLFAVIAAQRAPDGLLYATSATRLHTGLALRPDSTTDDFYYYRLPHLGATAWSILAATHTNPFAPP